MTTIVSISRPDRIATAAAIRAAPAADLIEVRLDALWHQPPDEATATEDLVTILDATDRPLLATLRPARQGGGYDGPEDIRINLLLAAARAGFQVVDLEDDNQEAGAIAAAFQGHADVVMSDHRMQECPSREAGLLVLQSMQDIGGIYDKLAFPTGSFMDTLRALELAHSHAHRNGKPAIAPIGGGADVRALLPLAGNHATYGHDGSGAVVPGQPAIREVQEIWRHWGLDDTPGDAEAGWLAVIGDPVDHSLSPRIHNAMLRHAGRKQRYGALRVPDSIGAVRLVTSVAHRIGLRGVSVTQPLKHHALAVSSPDDVARATGAANCLRFTSAGSEATNTDATALRRLLKDADAVAVLGAGGAARAAIWAAKDLDKEVTFTSRDAERAAQVAADAGARWVPWQDRDDITADTWVQATSAPVTCALAGVRQGIELVYKEDATPFMEQVAAAEASLVDGKQFLIEQALDAYRFWTGDEADRTIMEAAL